MTTIARLLAKNPEFHAAWHKGLSYFQIADLFDVPDGVIPEARDLARLPRRKPGRSASTAKRATCRTEGCNKPCTSNRFTEFRHCESCAEVNAKIHLGHV